MERSATYYDTIEKSVDEIDLKKLVAEHHPYYPSPATWEDEVLYFLMLDRFSDGKEYNGFNDINGNVVDIQTGRTTDLFTLGDAYSANRDAWFESGKSWCGGNLAGLKDKLGYLKRLGVTAVWISPIFKQTFRSNGNYHGYGIQNFLDVDPHFGTREELKDLVRVAHENGIRVILDIIMNHGGEVFAYKKGQDLGFSEVPLHVNGYKTDQDDTDGSLPFDKIDLNQYPEAWPHAAIWPKEFQDPLTWTHQGNITNWDEFPNYLDGDFNPFKDIALGTSLKDRFQLWDLLKRIKSFQKARTLEHLCTIFKFWIAYADIDGYRVDTVKHMDPGATRFFTNVIHEFAQSIGKENFYIIGEITFALKDAIDLVEATGLDAALGIGGIQDKLELLSKGRCTPGNPDNDLKEGYFDLFNNSLVDGKNSHQWYGKRVVTMFDDHDQVGTEYKHRYCGEKDFNAYLTLPLALALNLTTLGIPCIYYGSEQAFNGADERTAGQSNAYSDVFLRECMFGGGFGSLQSTGKHFFREDHPIYQWVSKVCSIRKQYPALRRGRQYLQKISATGSVKEFYYPALVNNEIRWVIAWSRAFADSELVCAMNTNLSAELSVWVTIAPGKHENAVVQCILSSDKMQEGLETSIKNVNGITAIKITVPAAGFVIYEKIE